MASEEITVGQFVNFTDFDQDDNADVYPRDALNQLQKGSASRGIRNNRREPSIFDKEGAVPLKPYLDKIRNRLFRIPFFRFQCSKRHQLLCLFWRILGSNGPYRVERVQFETS